MTTAIKIVLYITPFIILSANINAQSFCFYDPNTGPFYSNGSSGAIYDITHGDFNSDNHLDVVTANSVGANISFIPGYGDGTLGSPDTISLSGTLFCIASADLNGDTKLDIVTANSTTVYVLIGNGDGTFQPYVSYPAGGTPSRIYCKDINDDTNPDIIAAGSNGIFVLLGLGNGSFLAATNYLSGLTVNDVAIRDFDNDTKLDIVSTTHITATDSELSFLKGNGDGTFASSTSVYSMTYPENFIAGVTSNDIDGDGKIDVIVANSGNSAQRIEVYFGNGDGTFNSPVFYPTQFNPFYLYSTDIDNDLIEDIVVEEGNGFSVLKGNSNGTFNTPEHFSAVSTPNSLAIADFNEDGKTDIIIPSAYFGSPLIAVNLNCTGTGVGVSSQNENKQLNIFPNPFNEYTTIQFMNPIDNAEVNIYNSNGQRIKNIKNISGNTTKLSREYLPSGVYFVHLIQGNKLITVDKLVIVD
jgi:hypothetical protein